MKLKLGIILQQLGKSYVAYDNNTSRLHEFNETGYFILKRIKQKKSKTQITKDLTSHYNISQDKALEDLTSFIKELKNKDLIVSRK